MKCGPDEVDGFALCSGLTALNLSYTTRPDLQGLIPPLTYLIRDAIFRPRYGMSQPETSRPGRFSLNIHSLGELMDMYHARKATNRLDRIYALFGMSFDDPMAVGLPVDYNLPWGRAFQKLIHFLLSDQAFVDTWDDCAVAVIQGKGHICGKVSAVELDDTRGDLQHISIAWKNARGHFGQALEEVSQHAFRASAQPIRVGDAVCVLQGASKPTIVRFQKAYSVIIMITVPLEETYEGIDQETSEVTDQKWSRLLLASTPRTPMDFVMIWDWDTPQHDSLDRDYESFIDSRGPPPRPWIQSCDYLTKATRSWNFGILLNGLERHEDAWIYFQKAVEAHATASRGVQTSPGHGAWIAHEEALIAMNDLLIEDQDALAEAERVYNQPPLFWAAEKGHEGLVKLLFDTGAAVDAMTSDGWTPLFCAIEKGHENIMQLLLDEGARPDHITNGRTSLEWAAGQGHERVVRWLLGRYARRNSNILANVHSKALWAACEEGRDKIVRILLENGADVNGGAESFKDARGNSLWLASVQGHDKVVQILLENGAYMDAAADDRPDALQGASCMGNDKIVQMLLEWGADVNAQNSAFGTALHAASRGSSLKTVKILLEKGADVNAWRGCFPYDSPLLTACSMSREEIVQILLEWGADVNAQDHNGTNALHVASRRGSPNIVQMLLEKGADMNAQVDVHGNALQIACYEGCKENVRILLEWGADVNA